MSEKTQCTAALQTVTNSYIQIRTHSFYPVEEFVLFENDSQSYYRLYLRDLVNT